MYNEKSLFAHVALKFFGSELCFFDCNYSIVNVHCARRANVCHTLACEPLEPEFS